MSQSCSPKLVVIPGGFAILLLIPTLWMRRWREEAYGHPQKYFGILKIQIIGCSDVLRQVNADRSPLNMFMCHLIVGDAYKERPMWWTEYADHVCREAMGSLHCIGSTVAEAAIGGLQLDGGYCERLRDRCNDLHTMVGMNYAVLALLFFGILSCALSMMAALGGNKSGLFMALFMSAGCTTLGMFLYIVWGAVTFSDLEASESGVLSNWTGMQEGPHLSWNFFMAAIGNALIIGQLCIATVADFDDDEPSRGRSHHAKSKEKKKEHKHKESDSGVELAQLKKARAGLQAAPDSWQATPNSWQATPAILLTSNSWQGTPNSWQTGPPNSWQANYGQGGGYAGNFGGAGGGYGQADYHEGPGMSGGGYGQSPYHAASGSAPYQRHW